AHDNIFIAEMCVIKRLNLLLKIAQVIPYCANLNVFVPLIYRGTTTLIVSTFFIGMTHVCFSRFWHE
ncbi:hypothetical protein, partial [Yersinia pseudotuberculosis]|uniref:hypothetical protein n=1 Tax=Yersinia pseudotuberculosis TaxID=633 RepID=UPI001F2DBF62